MVRLPVGRPNATATMLPPLALVVEELGVHAGDANPLKRARMFDLLVVLPLITTLLLRLGSVTFISVPSTSGGLVFLPR
jgi:hypothetical protein